MMLLDSLLLISFLSTLPAAFALPNPALQARQGLWTSLANISVAPRQEHTTVFLPPSTIGILGGVIPNGESVSTTDIMQFYSILDNTWSTMAPIPRPLNHVNVAVSGGKIYVLGGLADANATAGNVWLATPESWVYDPASGEWSAITPIPDGEARGSAAMGVHEGKIYLAGGMRTLEATGPGGLQDTVSIVSIFDTKSGEWLEVPEAVKNIPEARDHAGAAVVEDKFYVLGGRDHGQLNVKDTVFILDFCDLEKGWRTSEARMPTPRGGVAAGVVGTKVYTFGGEGNQEVGSGVFNNTEAYNTVTDSWEQLTPMRIPRHGTYAVGVGNSVYIPGGGVLQGGGPVADFDTFTP